MTVKKLTSLVKIKTKEDKEFSEKVAQDFERAFIQTHSFGSTYVDPARIEDFKYSVMAIRQGDIPLNVKVSFPSKNQGNIENLIGSYGGNIGWTLVENAFGLNDINKEWKEELIEEWKEENPEITEDEIETKIYEQLESSKELFYEDLNHAKTEEERKIKGLRFRLVNSPRCTQEMDIIEKAINDTFPNDEKASEGKVRELIVDVLSKTNMDSTVLCEGNEVNNVKNLKRDFRRALEDIDNLTTELYHFFIHNCNDIAHYDIQGWKHNWGSVQNFVRQWDSDELSPRWKTDAIQLQKYMYKKVHGKPASKNRNRGYGHW